MEVWGTCQERVTGLQEAHTVVITLFLLFVSPNALFFGDFLQGPEAKLWLFLMEYIPFPWQSGTVTTRCLSWTPKLSTKCCKSNTSPKRGLLGVFSSQNCGWTKAHCLGSRGGVVEKGWRLSCHDSFDVFSRFNLHYSVWNSSPLQAYSFLTVSGQPTTPKRQNRSLEKVAALN